MGLHNSPTTSLWVVGSPSSAFQVSWASKIQRSAFLKVDDQNRQLEGLKKKKKGWKWEESDYNVDEKGGSIQQGASITGLPEFTHRLALR